ncbi:Nif3-like dinuclear metal center hexameric protein [Humidisolicoccus flavus]|uniref:Nif3-like dinuclear metal center hexameric protein n=1 Tax=Humidisolicoccus flavus TaxID=3111414 RepID=UPI00324C088A
MTTLAQVHAAVEELWPAASAEDWDEVGLVVGNPSQQIAKILLTVDVTSAVVAEAVAQQVDLIIAHHPLLLRGVSSIAETTPRGRMLVSLARNECALLTAHTNADIVDSGTSGGIARSLGLENVLPIEETFTRDGKALGLGRVGSLPNAITLGALARALAALAPATATGIRVAGDYQTMVQRVALCGGAGDSLLNANAVREADVYITSDLRHHPASDAREAHLAGEGPALIDISHWASEWLWLSSAAEELAAQLPGVSVQVSDLRTDPWDFLVQQ